MAGGVQRVVQPLQQVGKTQGTGGRLELRQPLARQRGEVHPQRVDRVRAVLQRGHQAGKSGKFRRQVHAATGLERFTGACVGEPVARRVAEVGAVEPGGKRPAFEGLQPAWDVPLGHAAFVEGAVLARPLPAQPVQQGVGALCPAGLERLRRGQCLGQGLSQRGRVRPGRQLTVPQGLQRLGQLFRRAPAPQHHRQGVAVQRVDLLAPHILHGGVAQCRFVGLQFFIEQAAAVEGMFTQHALTPGVDGVHGRVVHGVGGGGQAPGGLGACLAFGIGGQQAVQDDIGVRRGRRSVTPEDRRRLRQAGADAVAELARGGPREGHDEDLVHAARRGAMPQHQAQHQGGDGPGLAGAGTGLDELAARQRQGQRVCSACGQVISHRRPLGPAHPAGSSAPASAARGAAGRRDAR